MKKPALIISHLFFWIFNYFLTSNLFNSLYFQISFHLQYPNGHPKGKYYIEEDYRASLVLIAIGLLIFYASYFTFNYFIKRPLRFIWIALFFVIFSLVVSLPADFISNSAAIYLGPVMYFMVCGFLFKTCVEWIKDKKIKHVLEKDREESQLELLQSKIDSHFLFNNLNNIDVFIQEDPKLASDYLKKLSDILRFMLYEAGAAKVPLHKEMEYIQKYIDLQKIRTSNLNFVTFEVQGDSGNKLISPMILIHFIENAFKYASNKKIENAVTIRLEITGKRLNFYCKNHISSSNEAGSVMKGMGSKLLKQKLDMIYKKEYSLLTKEENNWYIVKLDMPLDEN